MLLFNCYKNTISNIFLKAFLMKKHNKNKYCQTHVGILANNSFRLCNTSVLDRLYVGNPRNLPIFHAIFFENNVQKGDTHLPTPT